MGKISDCLQLKNNYLYVKFSKNFETTLMGYSGAWGKLIREKT
jgi:hypothetical protein